MRVDALVLRAVAGELAAQLGGARIDPVIAPTPHAVALGCYGAGQNRWLLISAHPQLARLHLIDRKPQKLVVEPSAFVMLLRKHLEGARITAVRAVPWERIVELDVRHTAAEGLAATLIVEIMGNLSNIILVDAERTILGAVHHVNRYRAILPGQPYLPPPPQTRTLHGVTLPRLDPAAVTAEDLLDAIHNDGGARLIAPVDSPMPPQGAESKAIRPRSKDEPLRAGDDPEKSISNQEPVWKILTANVAGVSADFAQEVVCRAVGDARAMLAPDDAAGYARVAESMRELAGRAAAFDWQPTAILAADGAITDGALWQPCVAKNKPQQPMPGVNELLAAYFAAREWGDAIGSASGDLRRSLKSSADRLQKKLRALREDLAALSQGERLRHEGELLLAFASEITPHATAYTIPDLGDGAGPTPIILDPRYTAVENANLRFNKYHKLRRATEKIPEQIARAETDLARVAQLQTDLDLAETLTEIAHVRAEVTEARLGRFDREEPDPKQKKKKPPKGKPGMKGKTTPRPRGGGEPLHLTSPDGFMVHVGKNSHQNEYVTFDLGTANDIWLHARGVPGAHAIIKAGGRPVPQSTLEFAASLAAWYSQSRQAASVAVDYTEQRYVRHMKDGGPGMVIYAKERTIKAIPKAD